LTAELTGARCAAGQPGRRDVIHDAALAFSAFIHRLTGRIRHRRTVSDRSRTETEGWLVLFVHTVALRMDLRGDPTFCDLLARPRHHTSALAHQEIPFEEVVKALQPERASTAIRCSGRAGCRADFCGNGNGATCARPARSGNRNGEFDWTFLLEETDWG
jgi:non-ribosomal peptide synthetase component F